MLSTRNQASRVERTSAPLSTQLYHELRRRIIVGDYAQGSRLPEQRLAEELDVSRIPLREAIPQLETDGFVRSTPRRGVVVQQWTERSVHDLFDTRLAIEPPAARLGALRVAAGDSDGVSDLERALTVAEDALDTRDALLISTVNAELHQVMVATAGNDLMASLMRAVAGRMTWLFYLTSRRDPTVACAEHRAITEAVVDGDDRLAEALVFAHIEAGRRPSLQTMAPLFDDAH